MDFLSDKIKSQEHKIISTDTIEISTVFKNGFVIKEQYSSQNAEDILFIDLCKQREINKVYSYFDFFEKEKEYQSKLDKNKIDTKNEVVVKISLYYPKGKESKTTRKEFSVIFQNDDSISKTSSKQEIVKKLIEENVLSNNDIEFIKEIKIVK